MKGTFTPCGSYAPGPVKESIWSRLGGALGYRTRQAEPNPVQGHTLVVRETDVEAADFMDTNQVEEKQDWFDLRDGDALTYDQLCTVLRRRARRYNPEMSPAANLSALYGCFPSPDWDARPREPVNVLVRFTGLHDPDIIGLLGHARSCGLRIFLQATERQATALAEGSHRMMTANLYSIEVEPSDDHRPWETELRNATVTAVA